MERQCRLRCREGHLDIEEGDSRRSVFLEDLAAVVFASREISVSVCLLDELAARGYMPFVGFHHAGEANNINLACDCVEPFRPLVDIAVKMRGGDVLDKDYKARLLGIVNADVEYGGRRLTVSDAMDAYFLDVTRSLRDGRVLMKELMVL